jgi:hypothetical protein
MLKSRIVSWTLAAVLFAAGAWAWACEDDHPPIISTPAEKLLVRDLAGNDIVELTVDPRGVGAVAPRGDDDDSWVDSDDPTGVWHYREWQWWKGHPWGESCRPRFFSELSFHTLPESSPGAVVSYRVDGFDCRQAFMMPDSVDRAEPHWDLVTTIHNISRDVDEYGQFFACYTKMNRHRSFWYWDETNELVLFADRGVGHLDGYIAHPRAYFHEKNAVPHCPRGGGKIVGRWRRPVIISHASPAGWRSIVMIEPEYAAALAQGIEGNAMDYILFPGPQMLTFAVNTAFSAHIRHVMLKSPELPTIGRLEELWRSFERAHVTIREKAARLAERY